MTKTLALFVTVSHWIVFHSPRHSKLEVTIAKFPLLMRRPSLLRLFPAPDVAFAHVAMWARMLASNVSQPLFTSACASNLQFASN